MIDMCPHCHGAILSDESGCTACFGMTVQEAVNCLEVEPRPVISPASTKYRACGLTLARRVAELEDALRSIADETHPALVMSLNDGKAYRAAVAIAKQAISAKRQPVPEM